MRTILTQVQKVKNQIENFKKINDKKKNILQKRQGTKRVFLARYILIYHMTCYIACWPNWWALCTRSLRMERCLVLHIWEIEKSFLMVSFP